jgi:3-dehydroquinate synthase
VVQVPTTLLAQVDSAVGGKTAINHAKGKNLVGAFWQPDAVISSAAVLMTLPDRERRCGLAEALKHGFIANANLLHQWEREASALTALAPGPTGAMVEACCRIKAAVVAADEREAGGREVLNFGHTFGHAYERVIGYGAMTHGEAVALGMVLAARLSEKRGVAEPGLATFVASVLARFGLPHEPEAQGLPPMTTLIEAARHDKKGDGETIRFILLSAVGEAQIKNLNWTEIERDFAGSSVDNKVEE